MRHDQVDEGSGPEAVHVVEAHDDLRIQRQVPVHLGLEHHQFPEVGQDVALGPGLHRAYDIEPPGVHGVGYRGFPHPDDLVGGETARPQVHLGRADYFELLA